MEKLLNFPFLASESGHAIDHIIVNVHWIMFALFAFWGGFLVYTLVRFRKGANPKANPTGIKSKFAYWLAGLLAVIELYELFGASIPIVAQRNGPLPDPKNSVVVNVVAEQFAWNIHYPGNDGVFGRRSAELVSADNPLGLDRTDPAAKDDITTINQLNLPVDKPVVVHLSSKDVIHSFNLTVMRVKQDAMPGMNVPVQFTPTVIGNYEIACAQLCGIGHYRMRGFLNILAAADYDKWIAEQEAALTAPAQ
jgi:cytochrome c oxidase subunit 2